MKTKIKSLLIAMLLIVSCAMLFTACGDDEENNPDPDPSVNPSIYAVYYYKSGANGQYMSLELKEEGAYTLSYSTMSTSGALEVNEDETEVVGKIASGVSAGLKVFEGTISGKVLTVTLYDGLSPQENVVFEKR